MFQNEEGLEIAPCVKAHREAPGLPLEDEVTVDRRLQAFDVLFETRDDFVVRGGEEIGVLLDVAERLQFRIVEAAALVREGVEREVARAVKEPVHVGEVLDVERDVVRAAHAVAVVVAHDHAKKRDGARRAESPS